MNTPTHYRLESEGLLSKYGFRDGDMMTLVAEDVIGDREDYGPEDYIRAAVFMAMEADSLFWLVETYLLPELLKHHDLELQEFGTVHNPVRIKGDIDGKPQHYFFASYKERLTPEYVDVDIIEAADAYRAYLDAQGKSREIWGKY